MNKLKDNHPYDIVMPIGPNDCDIALWSIKKLFKLFSFKKLFIISSLESFEKIQLHQYADKTIFVDEEKLLPGVTLQSMKEYCTVLFSDPTRAGWYFQQFLKMGICKRSDISEYFLIWDADTIPLKPISFFENDKMLLSYKNEFHPPYFDTLKKIIGIEKQTNISFITEHMMIKKSVLLELINEIENANIEGKNWIEKILFAVDKTQYQSGFSEFETYGNYLLKNYPALFTFRKIKHKRSGSKITSKPTAILLTFLSFFRDTVSFEKGHH